MNSTHGMDTNGEIDRASALEPANGSGVPVATDDTDLSWLPAWRLREMIGKRQLTPTDVVEHFLARIEKLDPVLHAFDTLDAAGAREQAAAATRAVESGAELGPLHGIPIAVLDAHPVKGFRNGLRDIESSSYDDIFVERLREAGAVIVGTLATYSWEVKHGPRNPWDTTRDPGNSSRGAAVAVAAAMVPVALGEDGAGSTRLPAAWSGCIGLSTTRGLVPHIDYDTKTLKVTANTGPMTRDARDCAMVLQVIAGRDGRDFLSFQFDLPDYTAQIDAGVDGIRIAWTDDFGWSKVYWLENSADIVAFVKDAAFGLGDTGAVVEQIHEVWEPPQPTTMALTKDNPAMKLSTIGYDEKDGQQAFEDAWGKPHTQAPTPIEPSWPQDAGSDELYRYGAESRRRMVDTLERVLGEHDVLVSATVPMEAQPFREWGYSGRGFTETTYSAHTAMMNLIGYPAISVPCGLRNGLPVGMQIIARQGQEDLLLRVAAAVQKRYPLPHPPAAA